MSQPLRLLNVLAHPDDESLGVGGTNVRYANEGIETYLITATLGQSGRFGKHRLGDPEHPGREKLAEIREKELRAAAKILRIKEVNLLGYVDGQLDQADAREAVGKIAAHIRRIRPQVVGTFSPDGAYGHPDHIAICQLTSAAIVTAADPEFRPQNAPGEEASDTDRPHAVSKLYYFAWPASVWKLYQLTFKRLTTVVDGVEREAMPWPEWALTTVFDAGDHWETVWEAVQCHHSQMSIYSKLAKLTPDQHRELWGKQYFYRAFSMVNGGRNREDDLFEGLR